MITIPGRIPIRIYPFFWLLICLIGWLSSYTVTGTLIWAVVIFFSVLIHEYGHALTAIAFGQTAHIELVGLGGVTVRHGPRQKLWKEFIIVLNGPLAGFMIYVIASQFRYVLEGDAPDLLKYTIFITMIANLFWTIVNLLPIHPLDGGKLLSIILESIFGMAGVRAALLISSVLAIAVSVYFFLNQSLLGGALFVMLAFESYRAWQGSGQLSAQDDNEELQKALKEAETSLRSGEEEKAQHQLEQLRDKTKEGMIYLAATELLAKLYAKQGHTKEAYELLKPLDDALSPESLKLLHQLAYKNGHLKEAIELGDRAYQVYPGYETALTNAFSYALLGEVKPAVGWLKRAIGDGLPNLKAHLKRPEFDNIRSLPLFRELDS